MFWSVLEVLYIYIIAQDAIYVDETVAGDGSG